MEWTSIYQTHIPLLGKKEKLSKLCWWFSCRAQKSQNLVSKISLSLGGWLVRWIESYPLDANQTERAVRRTKYLARHGDPPGFQTDSSGHHLYDDDDGIFDIDGCCFPTRIRNRRTREICFTIFPAWIWICFTIKWSSLRLGSRSNSVGKFFPPFSSFVLKILKKKEIFLFWWIGSKMEFVTSCTLPLDSRLAIIKRRPWNSFERHRFIRQQQQQQQQQQRSSQ